MLDVLWIVKFRAKKNTYNKVDVLILFRCFNSRAFLNSLEVFNLPLFLALKYAILLRFIMLFSFAKMPWFYISKIKDSLCNLLDVFLCFNPIITPLSSKYLKSFKSPSKTLKPLKVSGSLFLNTTETLNPLINKLCTCAKFVPSNEKVKS